MTKLAGESSAASGAAPCRALAIVLAALLAPAGVLAGETEIGGDARWFSFLAVEDIPGRQDAQRGALRLKLDHTTGDRWSLEVHALSELLSPDSTRGDRAVLAAQSNRYFDLEYQLFENTDQLTALLSIDRLAVRYEGNRFRVIAGRQPVTWGVNYFWPVLDLFGPFRPDQIDRDYKPGIDAVRTVIAVGDFSEVQAIVAAQGPDLSDDLGYGSLARLHAGNADVGLMAGSFHGDTVLGGFLTGDLAGGGARGELSYTDADDAKEPIDPSVDKSSFWRATLGIDRQLGPYTTLIAEASFNGYGTDDPALYPLLARTPRVLRGEITSLGRYYSAASLGHQFSPRWTGGGALLVNWGDSSVLLQPSVTWTISDDAVALFGVIAGFGRGLDDAGLPGSEYGITPTTIWAAIKAYF